MTSFIHPNTPTRLAAKYKKLKSYHAVAEDRRVNVFYVHDLIHDGKEPNDTTPKLREVRRRLFLSTRKKRRFGDCAHCGKLIELEHGFLTSHSHPDGTYCKGSETQDFLGKPRKPKPEPPAHRKWWLSLDTSQRENIIRETYELNK